MGNLAAGLMTHPDEPSLCVLPAKRSDFDQWVRWHRRAGCRHRLDVFGPGRTFNWLQYNLTAEGGVTALLPMIEALQRLLTRNQPTSSDAYFIPQGTDLLAQAIRACWLGTGRVCVRDVYEFLNGFPHTDAGVEGLKNCDPGNAPFAYRVLWQLHARPEESEADLCLDYWLHQIPTLGRSEKTLACVLAVAQQVVRPFLTGPVASCMAGPTSTWTPECLEDPCVFFADFPVLTGFEGHRLALAVIAMSVNRYALRRGGGRGIVVVADEHAQIVQQNEDARIAAVGRSHKLGRIYVAQNLPQYAAALGSGEQGRQEAQALVGCLATWLLFNNPCRESNQHFSEVLGQRPQMLFGGSVDGAEPYDLAGDLLGTWSPRVNCSFSQHLQPVLPPQTFLSLLTGGERNGFVAECIALNGTRRFASGEPWCRASLKQVL